MTAAELVTGLYQAYQDRAWARAAAFLHPDAVVVMPSTAERLVGREAVLSFQVSYPEPWGTLSVLRVVAEADTAVAELRVEDPTGPPWAVAARWTTREGLLLQGVEYWIEIGTAIPPESRAAAPDTVAARRAGDR